MNPDYHFNFLFLHKLAFEQTFTVEWKAFRSLCSCLVKRDYSCMRKSLCEPQMCCDFKIPQVLYISVLKPKLKPRPFRSWASHHDPIPYTADSILTATQTFKDKMCLLKMWAMTQCQNWIVLMININSYMYGEMILGIFEIFWRRKLDIYPWIAIFFFKACSHSFKLHTHSYSFNKQPNQTKPKHATWSGCHVVMWSRGHIV